MTALRANRSPCISITESTRSLPFESRATLAVSIVVVLIPSKPRKTDVVRLDSESGLPVIAWEVGGLVEVDASELTKLLPVNTLCASS